MRTLRLAMETACVLLLSLTLAEAQELKSAPQTYPVQFIECEGFGNCGTWTLLNNVGVGTWPKTGEKAVLQITRSASQIVISRTDVEGSKVGLTATYKGVIENKGVSGTFDSIYDGKPDTGHWYWQGSPAQAGKTPPTELNITECEGQNCSITQGKSVSWTFNGESGVGVFGTGSQPLHLDSYDGTSIAVTRTDTVGDWLGSSIYTGRINGSRIEGTVQYRNRNGTRAAGVWSGVLNDAMLQQANGAQAEGPTLNDIYNGIDHLKTVIQIIGYIDDHIHSQN